jgi:nitrite reductase/ring-hydroxylating ferredoxin subunit
MPARSCVRDGIEPKPCKDPDQADISRLVDRHSVDGHRHHRGCPARRLHLPAPHARKEKIRVALDAPVAGLREGTVTRFDAPAAMAFVMADGGEQNAAGDLTFGGFLTRDKGKLRALAITCPHLSCSYAFDDGKKHFVCPCHGSEFALDGSVIHGPATSPLSHLTWEIGPGANEIDVEGLTIG